MTKIETEKIKEIYDYLSDSTNPLIKANGAFVFCRDDPLVAKKTATLFQNNLIDYAMFTGGIGKDSGYLTDLQLPEAKWQAALLNLIYQIPSKQIYVEPHATNGGECCRFGIDTVVNNSLPHQDLIIVCHPTSLRRTSATLEMEAKKKGFKSNYQRIGTDYIFNANNPQDQQEAIAELIRLTDWPAKGWCTLQEDLPYELVSYARELK